MVAEVGAVGAEEAVEVDTRLGTDTRPEADEEEGIVAAVVAVGGQAAGYSLLT